MLDLIVVLGVRMSVIATLAFIFTRTKLSKRLVNKKSTYRDKIPLICVFGTMGIIGTYTGILMEGGAIANSRVIGVMTGGLLGGPVVGISSGLIAGVHRYFVGGFTDLACGLSTVVEGLIGGLVYSQIGLKKINWQVAFWAGFVAETLQMIIILIFARPLEQAWELVQVIGLPMIFVNSIGIAIFITIINSIFYEQEKVGAGQAQKSLDIADKTLPYLRKGLNKKSAEKVADIIYHKCDFEAVAITDRSQILVHLGEGKDHHLPGKERFTGATRKALYNGEITVAKTRAHIDCDNNTCTLGSAVIVPLKSQEKVAGTLKLYHISEGAIGAIDIELAKGLSQLFSTQLELAEFEKQAERLNSAKIKALQAQINPHFLFNALNTIISLIRTKPETARELLIKLGEFFRNNLKNSERFVSLETELEHVKSYLTIEQARFGEKISVGYEIDDDVLGKRLPALLLQPIVENAIKHGILPQNGGEVVIKAEKKQNNMLIAVTDNGVGMSPEKVQSLFEEDKASASGIGIGLINVNERLRSIYGPDAMLQVESSLQEGTAMKFMIPLKGEKNNGSENNTS